LMRQPREILDEIAPDSIFNVGSGQDLSIVELAEMISQTVGFEGGLEFDSSKPDGTLRKLLDVSRMEKLGWTARISLKDGIAQTYDWYKNSNRQ